MILRKLTFCACALALCLAAFAQQPLQERDYTMILTSEAGHEGSQSWKMQNIGKISAPAEMISEAGFDTSGWMDAVVPGTVLTSLVNDGVYPDPYYGDNNKIEKGLIPDLSKVGRDFYTYWYRTELSFPEEQYKGKRTWLQLDGINYRAEVWLNGKLLSTIGGMFQEEKVDITDYILLSKKNALAIKVLPVDAPGKMMPKGWGATGEFHNGGDGEIGRNVTMLMTVGWDFTFLDGIRDRNTGIWKDIKVYTTGPVELQYPFVRSELAHPGYDMAKETISVEVWNPTTSGQKVTVEGRIAGTDITFSKDVSLFRGEQREIVFTPEEYPQLVIENPRLWWPVNKGKPELYDLEFKLICKGEVSDKLSTRFGIREIVSNQDSPDQSRTFYVNGKRLFITGTNWIPEAMCQDSAERTYAQLRYTSQTGINMLRLWGGGITESEYFYQLCDELGIMVWEEFWMTGDTKHPVDRGLYLKNMTSAVKRTRIHPSLAYYVSSNESTETYGAEELINRLDGTRGYQMQSECDGVHDGSPYKQVNPMRHYENTASDRGSRVDGFNPEYGAPCLPTVECLREIMDEKDLWPINKAMWDYHDGNGFHLVSSMYTDMVNQYGESSSIDEFAEKAQFVGALNYKSICEVWRYNKLDSGDRYAAGYLFWYHNNPVRQVCARMWDWSLEPTAALYAAQNATEPLHPQFDYLKNTVSVSNDLFSSFKGYKVVAEVYDLQSKKVWSKSAIVDIPEESTANDVITIDFPAGITPVHFIKLRLYDNGGKLVGSNFYWRSDAKYEGKNTLTGPTTSGFQAINQLPEAKVKASFKTRTDGDSHFIDLNLRNSGKYLAFFTQIQWLDAEGKPVRPSYYTDNFISLLPGESAQVTIETAKAHLPAGTYSLVVKGFHQKEQKFQITVK